MPMKLRNIPFSPPDMTEAEAKMATEAILSGWITTGPKTKEFERRISAYVHTDYYRKPCGDSERNLTRKPRLEQSPALPPPLLSSLPDADNVNHEIADLT